MSTGADCWVEEKERGKWYYSIQCYPYGATEEHDNFGPFASEKKACIHLHRHHANPGGYCVIPYEERQVDCRNSS